MKKTITIGVPAHNEEANILNLLRSISVQNNKFYHLDKIYVFCDGCTDNTCNVVKNYESNNAKVVLVDDGKRLGKVGRLGQLYTMNKSDIVINFDGDIVLHDKNVIDNIVRRFSAKDITLVGAHAKVVKNKTFFGKSLNAWSKVWHDAKISYNDGKNIYNCRGCGLALTKDFAKSVSFPNTKIPDSQFLFLTAKTRGKLFDFAKDAVVFYRKPELISDYLLQIRRTPKSGTDLSRYFGSEVKREYLIPAKIKYRYLLKNIFINPFYTISGAVIVNILNIISKNKTVNKDIKGWETSPSTKESIDLSI